MLTSNFIKNRDMKKIIFLALPLFIGILSGCSDYLEIDPIAQENEQTFFTTPENCTAAVNAAYDVIGQDEGSGPDGGWISHNFEFMFGDVLSYDVDKGSSETDFEAIQQMAEWRATSNNGPVGSVWLKCYDGINRCNTLLSHLDDATFDPAVVANLKGQAYFLRGYFYFNLIRVFGGVVIIEKNLTPDQFGAVQRASLHDSYVFAAEQFKKAIDLLPLNYDAANAGRATKGAAMGYLARLYTYQIGMDKDNTTVNYQMVYDLTSAIIASGQYKLLSNYAQIFEEVGENSSESVFELQYIPNAASQEPGYTGTVYSVFTNSRGGWGWGFQQPTQDLFEAYEAQDPRLFATLCGPTINGGVVHGAAVVTGGDKPTYKLGEMMTPYYNRKCQLEASPATSKNSGYNMRYMRYAEILFLQAEAAINLGNNGEAEDLIEQVRARARTSTYPKGWKVGQPAGYEATGWSGNLPVVGIAGLTKDQAIDKLLEEKRKEFACESIRFWDLVRTNKYLDMLDHKKATSQFFGVDGLGALRYANVDLKANCLEKCIDGPNGVKVPLLPIPLAEVESWGLTQNKGY